MMAAAPPAGDIPPMPVIVGAPRSGTTLLRFMLDAHPDLAIPPETGFLTLGHSLPDEGEQVREHFFEAITHFPPDAPAWDDFGVSRHRLWSLLQATIPFTIADGYRAFYRAYAERFGKPRWGDKTPMHCLHLAAIQRVLPEAYFVHVIRDGRDVALSLRQTWFSPGSEIETLAEYWMTCVTTARRQAAQCRHYLELRFEELVQDTDAVLARVCRFIDLAYSPEMVTYHRRTPERLKEHRDRTRPDGTMVVSHADRLRQQMLTTQPPRTSRVQAWRTDMPLDERARFERVAGDLLVELGYGALVGS